MPIWKDKAIAAQLRDTSGITYGPGMHPMDIDFCLEWRSRLFIFGELKFDRAPLVPGQRYLLEHLVTSLETAGKQAFALHVRHMVKNPERDIPVADCEIVAVYHHGRWQKPKQPITVKQFCDQQMAAAGYREK